MILIHHSLILGGLVLVLWAGPTGAAAPMADENEPVKVDKTQAPADPLERLLVEMSRLTEEVSSLRLQLAEARLRSEEAERELEELRQFIRDHHELGNDFAQYRTVKAITERESRQRLAEANRQRREADREARRQRAEEIRKQREAEQAEDNRLDRYRKAGFSPLGLNVFIGRMAYSYNTLERNPVRVDYDPFIGLYYRPGGPLVEIDYSTMTISGSLLNASEEVRNVGIAITFFDENGAQVGGEIVRLSNARPDVPYPFTATLDMALDRPFSSSSTYVLYADLIQRD
jgi:hypothetical protein